MTIGSVPQLFSVPFLILMPLILQFSSSVKYFRSKFSTQKTLFSSLKNSPTASDPPNLGEIKRRLSKVCFWKGTGWLESAAGLKKIFFFDFESLKLKVFNSEQYLCFYFRPQRLRCRNEPASIFGRKNFNLSSRIEFAFQKAIITIESFKI